MSRLSRYLCLPTCLGLGLAFFAYGTLSMPGSGAKVEAVGRESPPPLPDTSPPPLAPLKPKPKASLSQATDLTGSIGPQTKPRVNGDQVNGERLPQVPGIRFAALGAQAVPAKPHYPNRWAPAVLYHPIGPTSRQMSTNREMVPLTARKLRKVRAGRPYYRVRPRFSVVIGVGPRW